MCTRQASGQKRPISLRFPRTSSVPGKQRGLLPPNSNLPLAPARWEEGSSEEEWRGPPDRLFSKARITLFGI